MKNARRGRKLRAQACGKSPTWELQWLRKTKPRESKQVRWQLKELGTSSERVFLTDTIVHLVGSNRRSSVKPNKFASTAWGWKLYRNVVDARRRSGQRESNSTSNIANDLTTLLASLMTCSWRSIAADLCFRRRPKVWVSRCFSLSRITP